MIARIEGIVRRLIAGTFAMGFLAVCAVAFISSTTQAATGINGQINFQGRLLNAQGAVVPDGFYNVQFKIYQDGDGQAAGNPSGTLKWTESHLNNNSRGVQVKNGFMSVQLGSVTAFGASVDWNQDTLWLSMNIGNTNATCTPFASCSPDGEMVPMKRLSSTPYAMNAGQLGGMTSAQFLQLAQGVQTDASTNTTSVFINKTSTGNFLQLQSSGTDVFTVSNAGDIALGNNADHSITIATSGAGTVGREFSISAGTGGSGTGSAGGNLVLQGGAAGGTNANGGDVVINAGAKTGSGMAGAVSIGTSNTSAINLNQNTTVAAGKALALNGGTTGTRPASPTEGMLYFDTTTKQLLTYANNKWQADRTEAVIIAASNSSQADKDAADYVADGNTGAAADGDQVQINAALTAASGKKVILLAGTYVADATILIPNNTTLAGVGRGTLIELADIDAFDNLIENSDTATGTGVAIQDLRLDGRDDLNTVSFQHGIHFNGMGGDSGATARQGGYVNNVVASNFKGNGFSLSSANNTKLTNNASQNNNYGFRLSSSSYNTLANNTAQGSAVNGFDSSSGTHNTITGNTSDSNAVGYFFTSEADSTITNNTAVNSSDDGFNISGAQDTVISGNRVSGGADGIEIYGSSKVTISSNTLGTLTTGIYVYTTTDSTISNNTISITTSSAIRLRTSANNNVISSNKITDSGDTTANNAIHVDASDSNSITGNLITDSSATSNNYAIYIVNATSDTNYLADNMLGTGTVNDLGTGTVFGGQVNSSGNYVVQPAGTIELMKNTTIQGGTLTLGTSSVAGSLVISDGSSNTATISVGSLGGNYTYAIPVTTANDSFCLQTLANCSGIASVGTYSTTNTAADGATISGSSIIFQDASATAPGMVGTGTQTFAGNKTFNGTLSVNDVSVAANKSITITGGATGSRPASPTEGMIFYDTTTKQLLTYANGKWQADRSEAVIVAANNSSDADKAAADYIADGNTGGAADGDQVQINAALTAGSGKKVVLLAGTYVADATILIPNNTVLTGVGKGTVIELADLDATDNLIENSDTGTGTNIAIRDLKLNGRKDLNTAGTQHGIYFNGMGGGTGGTARPGATVTNIIVSNFRNYGVDLNASANGTFTSNNFQANTSSGFHSINSDRNSFVNNLVQGNGGDGFTMSTATNNTFTGNVLEGNTGDGFSLGSSNYNTFSGNTINGGSTGFSLTASTDNSFSGNSIQATSNYGFYFVLSSSNNTISGNRIVNSGGSTNNNALYFSSSDSNVIAGNSVTDSSATSTNYAIYIPGATSDTNYLANNTLGTGSINDLGTGTIYGGQVNSSGNYIIQPAGTIELMKNTAVTTGTLTVGGTSTQGSLVVSDGSSNTATIQVGNLAGNYTYTIPVTTANDTFCLVTLANCAATGVTAVGTYSTTNTAADGATISGNSIIFQDASATAPGMMGTGTQTFAGNKTFNGSLTLVSDVSFDASANHAVSVATTASGVAGKNLSLLAGNGGVGGAGTTGGTLVLQGGNGGGGSGAGGDVTLSGGTGSGTGVKGLVNLGPSAYTAVTNSSCAADCTIAQSNVDNYGTIIVNATTSGIIITLPAPTNTSTQGRTIFITTAAGGQDFTLRTNSGGNQIDVAMRQNTTSTMIWNGTAWTPGGASNATTLQATYNNGSNPATTPEIKLDTIRGTIDIQDADTSIGTDILNIRGSNAAGLGTVLFGVSETGRVTIQGTTDQNSAFRVLSSNGDYLFNINSNNSYVISNATRAPGNEVSNPGLETGGEITSGEEGWFGPATVTIENSAANAKAGNHLLQITANSSNVDAFAGKYYEVQVGEGLYFEGWVKNSAGANGNAGIQITWYDKDKAVLSNSTAYPGTPGTTYTLRTLTAVAPASAHYARVSATIRSNATTGTFYFDNFYMKRNLENADMLFRNSADSSTAFRIQSAGAAQTLFTANTSNNTVKIGDNAGTDTNTTLLVLDSTTADPTTLTGLNGGIFYRSDNNSLKAVIGGAVVDICTTAVTCSGYSASAGSTVQLQASSPGTQQVGHFNITGTGMLTQLQTQDNGSGSTQNLTIRTGNATGGNSGNLILDVGTASGTLGTITIGHAGVATTMPGTLSIQGSSTLSLGTSSSASGSILFKTSTGANTVTLVAPAANPTSSYTLTLPTNLGGAGECIKTDATGNMYFQGCGVGVNFNLQDAYNNSGTPADITLADGKDLAFTAADTAGTDPSFLVNLQCVTSCGANGRFAVQNAGSDILSVLPNGGGIVLNAKTQVGSGTTDGTQVNLQLDSYNGGSDVGGCSTTVNQGAMYYNTAMGSIRSCINGSWSDVSNPDTLGLLTFGIVPSSGSQPYDLPSLVTPGYSGPCKVSWASTTSVHVEPCTAYSNGRRLTVASTTLDTNSSTAPNTNLTTTNRWGHVCLNPTSGQPEFTSTSGLASLTAGMPTFSASNPILCLADVVGSSTTAGTIDDLYDVRTFTSAMKEAVTVSTAVQLGMMADSSSAGIVPSATCSSGTCSGKLYGLVVATDGGTSAGAPNAIVTSVGPGFVKSISGNAGEFAKASTTAGYAATVTAIPNNAFYYSPGNTRTSFSTTCTSAANCSGSMYVNFIVR